MIRLTRKIFLTDIEGTPPFDTVQWTSISDITNNALLIGRAQSGKTDRLKAIVASEPDKWKDLRVELKEIIENENYRRPYYKETVLILDHFEFNIKDPAYNLARLRLLESLLYEDHCRLVIVSAVDPLYFLTAGAPQVLSIKQEEVPGLLDRWARVLNKFRKVNLATSDNFVERIGAFAQSNSENAALAFWVWMECSCTAFLRKIGTRLLKQFQDNPVETRGSLVNMVIDRADAYYHVLWSNLTTTERLVLYQLALDGWVNAKNSAAIQQLERKQLICRAPMYRVMNDSFCKFIASFEHAEEIATWERDEQQSTWQVFKFVLIASGIGVGVWVLYAQSGLFQIGVGYAAAIATLLTAIASLIGRSKRPSPADTSGTGGRS